MSGCDYLDNIKGIGFQRVLKAIQEPNSHHVFEEMISKVIQPKESSVYLKNVELAKHSFEHQIVFNSSAKRESEKLVHLNALPQTMLNNKAFFEPYTGSFFRFVDSYSKGERCFKNENEFRPVEASDFDKLLRFFSYVPRPVFGCMTNLTQRTIGFGNFHEFDDVLESNKDDYYVKKMKESKQEIIQRNKELIERRNNNKSFRESCATVSTKCTLRRTKLIKKGEKLRIRSQRKRIAR